MRANPYVRFVRDTIDATTGRGDDASIVVSRFVHALGALKYAFIPPETKAGMFPLMMPVGISPEDGNAIGFLLEPSSVNEEEKITLGPIVKAKPNQKQIEFIAKDATTFVRRVLLEEELAALAASLDIQFAHDSVLLNGENVSVEIRVDRVTKATRSVADAPSVREEMKKMQRSLSEEFDLVTEGRDQGTVVFPHAELKIYLDASPSARAARRSPPRPGC